MHVSTRLLGPLHVWRDFFERRGDGGQGVRHDCLLSAAAQAAAKAWVGVEGGWMVRPPPPVPAAAAARERRRTPACLPALCRSIDCI